jgi:BON domain-containing protein
MDDQQHRDTQSGVADRDEETSPSGGFRGQGPRGYERSNERIYEDVCEWLTEDDEVDASDIEVEVENGIVILRGTVGDRGQKRRAEDIAERASGVRDVRNQLEIGSAMLDDLSKRVGRSSRNDAGDDEALGSFRDPTWAERDLRGFEVEARDGKIGSVDERSEPGSDHLIVDTGTWIFGKKVVLPVGLVEKIAFEERRLLVSRSKEEIKHAPDFDEEYADDPRYAEELRAYYGREQSLRR